MPESFSDREVGDLLLRVCHDFGAPLRAININSELLRKEGNTAPREEFEQHLEFILAGAAEADLLKKGLASYAVALQVEPHSFRPAPLGVLVRSVVAKLQKQIAATGAEVTVADMPTVFGDQDRLMEVFEQILRNALVHRGPAAPQVQVVSQAQEGGWLLTVHDNGPGLDERYLDSIFRPFEQLRRQERTGPGLGLAICKAIVERHGGRIWAELPPAGGCRICWTLPDPSLAARKG